MSATATDLSSTIDPSSASRISSTTTRWLSTLAAGVGLMVAQILRNPKVLDRIWAEDGAVFAREAFDGHIWQQIGRGYAGYLLVPQRTLAAPIVSVVPPSQWAHWFTLASVAVAAFAALAVFRLSEGILHRWETRAALAVLVAVGPKMRGEWPAISNVGWPLLVAIFWAIVSVRIDRPSTLLRCAIAAAAITSSGLGLAFLPLAVLILAGRDLPVVARFLDRSSLVDGGDERARLKRADRYVLFTIVVAGALQVLGTATSEAGQKAFRTNTTDIAKLLVVRVFGSVVVGERFIDEAWRSWGMWFGLGALVIVAVGLVVLLRRSDRSRRSLAIVAVGYAVAIGAASLRTRGTEPFALQPHRFSFDAERYFVIPAFLVISAIAIAVDRWCISPSTDVTTQLSPAARSLAAPRAFAVFVVVVLIGAGFNVRNKEEPSDPWSVALRVARSTCTGDPGLARVDIPIAPAGIFRLNVPCSRLR